MYNLGRYNLVPFGGVIPSELPPVTAIITANASGYNTSIDATYEGTIPSTNKPFFLFKNDLSGDYVTIGDPTTVGWASGEVSKEDGTFDTNPLVTITYSREILIAGIHFIQLQGATQYAKHYILRFYDTWGLVHTHEETDGSPDILAYYQDLTVLRIELEILEMSLPGIPAYLSHVELAAPNVAVDLGYLTGISESVVKELKYGVSEGFLVGEVTNALTVRVPNAATGYLQDESVVKGLENMHSAMNSSFRAIHGKVTITYTESLGDESRQTLSANGTAYPTSLENLYDDIEGQGIKWFSLHDNDLTGNFKLLPSNNSQVYSPGWWGTVMSNDSGVLAPTEELTITFSARQLIQLQVMGDSYLGYPVDFEVIVYDAADQEVLRETVVGNSEVLWLKRLDTPVVAAKYILRVSKISKANSTLKLSEVTTALKETYYDDELITISLLEEVGYNTGALPIGNVSSNEIDIDLSNADRHFDLNNTNSSIHGYIKRNRKVQAWLGAMVGSSMEWEPLGTFWTSQWDIPRDKLAASLVARDRLDLMRLTDFNATKVLSNQSIYDLFEMVFIDGGILEGGYYIDARLKDIIVPYAWFDKMSHRQAIQRIAGSGIIQVYCNRVNVIVVTLMMQATSNYTAVFDDDVNVFSSTFPLAVAEQVNYVETSYTGYYPKESQNVLETGEELAIPAGVSQQTFRVSGAPLLSLSGVSISTPGITVQSYSYDAYNIYVTLNSTVGAVNNVKIEAVGVTLSGNLKGEEVAKDDALIREDGTIRQSVSHDFIQTKEYARYLSDTLLSIFKGSRSDVTMETRGDAAVWLGDRILVNDSYDNVQLEYVTTRQRILWDGTLSATVEAKRL